MTNVFNVVKDFLEMNLDNEPKSPLHVGEVMGCWMYIALMDEAKIFIQIGLNSTNDDEVKKHLNQSLKQCDSQTKRFKELLRSEGVHLPPSSEERPNSDPNSIPLGAKLTDDEIMNGLSMKTVTAVVHCATAASESIRTDIGASFTHCMIEKMKFGVTLRNTMKKRGWIKVPPYYYPPGMPKK
ncbi:DUF3231 family protein [Virgibacillus ndiopensis]|uniref:DUF3231 family protein n=1 Tax=Virgibacillus ndiopensis TaxID=2004408 RepID=UPI000C07B466|nr:DUF3231 family protein [Virgibacillus ndiopensis]